MSEIIWQPDFCADHNFRIVLNPRFASDMAISMVSKARQDKMNEIACNHLERMYGVVWREPYTFHGGSGLISQIYRLLVSSEMNPKINPKPALWGPTTC